MDSARLSWSAIIGPLAAAGRRVYAPDVPGYGESDRPVLPYSTDYYVGFVGDFMDALGLGHAGVMGLSMGGAIALGLALAQPSRVDRLVLVDSYGLQRNVAMQRLSYLMVRTPGLLEASYWLTTRSRSLVRASLAGIVNDPGKLTPALIEGVWAEARKPHAGRAAIAFQRHDVLWNGVRTVFLDRLGELRCPVLLIHGRQDKLVPLHWAEEAHARIPGSQLHVIEGAGHWPHPEKPEELIRVASEFLKD